MTRNTSAAKRFRPRHTAPPKESARNVALASARRTVSPSPSAHARHHAGGGDGEERKQLEHDLEHRGVRAERGEARAPVPPHGGGVDEAHQRVRQKRAQRGNREGRHLTQLLAPEHAEQRVGGVFLFEVFFSRRAGSGSFSRRRSREPRRRAGVAAGTRRGRQRAARGVAIVRSVFNVKIRSAFESRLRVLDFFGGKGVPRFVLLFRRRCR